MLFCSVQQTSLDFFFTKKGVTNGKKEQILAEKNHCENTRLLNVALFF
jgi:hypothetical protein